MVYLKHVCWISTFLLLVSCASNMQQSTASANMQLEKQGSPDRWSSESAGNGVVVKKYLIGKVAETLASDELQKDIFSVISDIEKNAGQQPEFSLNEVRFVEWSETIMQEVWKIKRTNNTIAVYVVTLRPARNNGTDIKVTGPW